MSLIVKESGNGPSIPPIDPGMYQAVCVAVYDLGSQMNEEFKKTQRKAYIEWEIQEERIEIERDGKKISVPRIQRKKYTLSLNEKAALRKDLDAWRGRPFTAEELDGFDLLKLLGANCYLNIIQETSKDGKKIYANIASIAPLRKTDAKLKPENGTTFFSFDDGKLPGEDVPEWIRKIMAESPEYAEISGGKAQSQEDDVPPPSDEHEPSYSGDVPF